jgi:hypothetical protein
MAGASITDFREESDQIQKWKPTQIRDGKFTTGFKEFQLAD